MLDVGSRARFDSSRSFALWKCSYRRVWVETGGEKREGTSEGKRRVSVVGTAEGGSIGRKNDGRIQRQAKSVVVRTVCRRETMGV